MTSSWRSAFSLLTRLPVGAPPGDEIGARWFGVVGAVVGGAGLVPILAFGPAMPAAAAILAIATMAVLTGAFHLDGLADTADALLAPGPDAAERARKDPRIGAGGATALILVLGLQAVALATVMTTSGVVVAALACVIASSTSRAAPLVLGVVSRTRASGAGLGASFARRVGPADAVVATASAFAIAFIAAAPAGPAGLELVVGAIIGLATGVALGLAIVRLRGQLDGDSLGATVELGFTATVLAAAAIGRWPAA